MKSMNLDPTSRARDVECMVSGENNYSRLFSSELLKALSLPPTAGEGSPESLSSTTLWPGADR